MSESTVRLSKLQADLTLLEELLKTLPKDPTHAQYHKIARPVITLSESVLLTAVNDDITQEQRNRISDLRGMYCMHDVL